MGNRTAVVFEKKKKKGETQIEESKRKIPGTEDELHKRQQTHQKKKTKKHESCTAKILVRQPSTSTTKTRAKNLNGSVFAIWGIFFFFHRTQALSLSCSPRAQEMKENKMGFVPFSFWEQFFLVEPSYGLWSSLSLCVSFSL